MTSYLRSPAILAQLTPRCLNRHRLWARVAAPIAIRGSRARNSGKAAMRRRCDSVRVLKEAPLPAKPVPDPVIPSITHTFSRKSDDRIELETRDADRVFRAVVLYALGSGRHGITMLARDDASIDRELRISYFGLDQSWGQTKGIDFAPRDAGDHIGIGLGRKTLNHCLSCHTTWFRSVAPDSSHAGGPEREDHGIGCERYLAPTGQTM